MIVWLSPRLCKLIQRIKATKTAQCDPQFPALSSKQEENPDHNQNRLQDPVLDSGMVSTLNQCSWRKIGQLP